MSERSKVRYRRVVPSEPPGVRHQNPEIQTPGNAGHTRASINPGAVHFEVHPQGGPIYQNSVNPSTRLAENVGRHAGTVAPTSGPRTPRISSADAGRVMARSPSVAVVGGMVSHTGVPELTLTDGIGWLTSLPRIGLR